MFDFVLLLGLPVLGSMAVAWWIGGLGWAVPTAAILASLTGVLAVFMSLGHGLGEHPDGYDWSPRAGYFETVNDLWFVIWPGYMAVPAVLAALAARLVRREPGISGVLVLLALCSVALPLLVARGFPAS